MKKIYDAVAVIGTYRDSNNVEKRRFLKVGVVFEGNKGLSLKLDTIPCYFNGWINFYPVDYRPKTSTADQRPETSTVCQDNLETLY